MCSVVSVLIQEYSILYCDEYMFYTLQDQTVRIWDTALGQCVRVLGGHSACVTSLRWSGADLLYSGSQDRSIRVVRASDVRLRSAHCLLLTARSLDSLVAPVPLFERTLGTHSLLFLLEFILREFISLASFTVASRPAIG